MINPVPPNEREEGTAPLKERMTGNKAIAVSAREPLNVIRFKIREIYLSVSLPGLIPVM